MNDPKRCARLLAELYRAGQGSESSDIFSLARAAGASLLVTLRALQALERAGLVDARRLRLTLPGLALAAAFSRRREEARASGASSARAPRPFAA